MLGAVQDLDLGETAVGLEEAEMTQTVLLTFDLWLVGHSRHHALQHAPARWGGGGRITDLRSPQCPVVLRPTSPTQPTAALIPGWPPLPAFAARACGGHSPWSVGVLMRSHTLNILGPCCYPVLFLEAACLRSSGNRRVETDTNKLPNQPGTLPGPHPAPSSGPTRRPC